MKRPGYLTCHLASNTSCKSNSTQYFTSAPRTFRHMANRIRESKYLTPLPKAGIGQWDRIYSTRDPRTSRLRPPPRLARNCYRPKALSCAWDASTFSKPFPDGPASFSSDTFLDHLRSGRPSPVIIHARKDPTRHHSRSRAVARSCSGRPAQSSTTFVEIEAPTRADRTMAEWTIGGPPNTGCGSGRGAPRLADGPREVDRLTRPERCALVA